MVKILTQNSEKHILIFSNFQSSIASKFLKSYHEAIFISKMPSMKIKQRPMELYDKIKSNNKLKTHNY